MREPSREANARSIRWIVVNTQPHRERLAGEHLGRQGFASYCPKILRTIKHARRVENVLRPIFPGYLFVEITPDMQRWQAIGSTIGVRSIVRRGQDLSFLDVGFIDSLKRREVDGMIARPAVPYAIGQSIKIAGGPFDGLVAEIIRLPERDRLMVLMDILNQPTKVQIDIRQVAVG
jgi:transcriptional antiterminator RfaH